MRNGIQLGIGFSIPWNYDKLPLKKSVQGFAQLKGEISGGDRVLNERYNR